VSDLANELRQLCDSECRNRIDYRCVVCRAADAVEQLAEARAALAPFAKIAPFCEDLRDCDSVMPRRSHLVSEYRAAARAVQ
jgi:hypothetical protein